MTSPPNFRPPEAGIFRLLSRWPAGIVTGIVQQDLWPPPTSPDQSSSRYAFSFAIMRTMAGCIGFHEWYHLSAGGSATAVYPDGCRDVLVVRAAGEAPRAVLTQLDFRSRTVSLAAGTEVVGYRLRPGSTVDGNVLRAISLAPEKAPSILIEITALPCDLQEMIDACALPLSGLRAICGNLGVSARTMQRRLRAAGLPPPDFWRLLARARRAVGALRSNVSLADVASDCGYSDQAHMTRETFRWFQQSPARIRRDVLACNLLSQPGLGNWTGEQISTR